MKLKKIEVPFTQVRNEVLQSKTLSWKAKGLFAYLYSKPDGWQFSSERIKFESNGGVREIQTGLLELEEAGYLERERQANGRILYHLKWDSLSAESADCGKASLRKAQTAESADISNKDNIIINSNNNKDIAKPAVPQPFVFEESLKKLEDDPRLYVQLVGYFFRVKKLRFTNREQMSGAIARHVRAAKMCAAFEKEKVIKAFKEVQQLAEQKPFEWTLETIHKQLTK